MSVINLVEHEVVCRNCHTEICLQIEFRFGYVRLLKYKIGDRIEWGKGSVGDPSMTRVVANGYANSDCPECQAEKAGGGDEYYVFIEDGTIQAIELADGRYDFSGQDFLLI